MPCQVDTCMGIQVLPMRGDTTTCVGYKHPVSVHQDQSDDDITLISGPYSSMYFSFYQTWLLELLGVSSLAFRGSPFRCRHTVVAIDPASISTRLEGR